MWTASLLVPLQAHPCMHLSSHQIDAAILVQHKVAHHVCALNVVRICLVCMQEPWELVCYQLRTRSANTPTRWTADTNASALAAAFIAALPAKSSVQLHNPTLQCAGAMCWRAPCALHECMVLRHSASVLAVNSCPLSQSLGTRPNIVPWKSQAPDAASDA